MAKISRILYSRGRDQKLWDSFCNSTLSHYLAIIHHSFQYFAHLFFLCLLSDFTKVSSVWTIPSSKIFSPSWDIFSLWRNTSTTPLSKPSNLLLHWSSYKIFQQTLKCLVEDQSKHAFELFSIPVLLST